MIARKSTKEILAESFRELAQEKPIDKITVKDIVQNCGYSQATFYRQFKDKYDLIMWEHLHRVSNIMNRGQDQSSWKQTLTDGAKSFYEEREYFTNLLRHTGGHDSFIRYMTDINYSELKRYIFQHTGQNSLDEMTDLYVRLYVYGTVTLTCEWILGGCKESPETIAKVYENSLPVPLHTYLLK